MKKIIIHIFLLWFLLLGTSAEAFMEGTNFYFFGFDIKSITEDKHPFVIGLGAISSIDIHVVGHCLIGEINNLDYTVHSFPPYETAINGSDNEYIQFALGGFALQHTGALLMTYFDNCRTGSSAWHSFTKGYVGACALETWSYPLRDTNDGDFYNINKQGGNGDLWWGIFSLLSIHEILRVNWGLVNDEYTSYCRRHS